MSKFYQWCILLKYNYYKLYWKFKKPAKRNRLYEWKETNYNATNSVGIVICSLINNKL